MKTVPMIRRRLSPLGLVRNMFEAISYRRRPEQRPISIPPPFQNRHPKLLGQDAPQAPRVPLPIEEIEQLIHSIRLAHIQGMGGAAFPTAEKLERFVASPARERVLIINAVECDPGLVHDRWIAETYTGEWAGAVDCIARLAGIERIIFAHSDRAPEAVPKWMEDHTISSHYPAGQEALLIRSLFGRSLQGYPADEGFLVMNLQTLLMVWRKVICRQEEALRYLSLVDLEAKTASIVAAKEGERLSEVAERLCLDEERLYLGGGVMHCRRPVSGERLDGSVNAIVLGTPPNYSEQACRGCMQCTIHCPAGLAVHELVKLRQEGSGDVSETAGCMGCGTCSYLCPAGIHVEELIESCAKKEKRLPDPLKF